MSERFVLTNQSSELPAFRSKIRPWLTACGWNEKQTTEWTLVLDEALTNVIRHAYAGQPGEILVEAIDSVEETCFIIEDQGRSFDPTAMPSPELPKKTPGGLGVHLIRTLTDRFEYEKKYPIGNRIRLIRLKADAKRSLS